VTRIQYNICEISKYLLLGSLNTGSVLELLNNYHITATMMSTVITDTA